MNTLLYCRKPSLATSIAKYLGGFTKSKTAFEKVILKLLGVMDTYLQRLILKNMILNIINGLFRIYLSFLPIGF